MRGLKLFLIVVAIFLLIVFSIKIAKAEAYDIGSSITVGMTATVDNSVFLNMFPEDKLPENLRGKTVNIDGTEFYTSEEPAQIVKHDDGFVEIMY